MGAPTQIRFAARNSFEEKAEGVKTHPLGLPQMAWFCFCTGSTKDDVRQQARELWQPWPPCKRVPSNIDLAGNSDVAMATTAEAPRQSVALPSVEPRESRTQAGRFVMVPLYYNTWNGRIVQVTLAKPMPATARCVCFVDDAAAARPIRGTEMLEKLSNCRRVKTKK